ncbi:MAG: tRNA-dihydrouridine synthase family protein [Bacteroidaceae bacterium]|nr:tRNA-dihydrouridine synthase family protein [Bacteroidaceae bacterium]
MTIRNLDLGDRPLLLAPMEDVTDIGFRLLCRRMGAAMVYSEFVNCDALVRMVKQSLKKLEVCAEERPVAIQIYGKDPATMAEAARIVVDYAHPDVLDINFGCPVKKIATKGAGAGLLQDPPRLLAITRAVVDAVGAEVPVTVKTRLGWDMEHRIIITLAEELQDCGIDALTIHGRTRSQLYTDHADWTLIGQVRANPRMRIPIIGNGDIHSVAEADSAFDRYGVDAVMIGRATFGQPWVFARRTFTTDEKLDILRQQVLASVERLDEYRGILHSRRHLAASPLFKGIPDFRQKRIDMLRADTVESLFAILDDIRPLLAES